MSLPHRMLAGTVFTMSVWPVDTPMLQTDFSGRIVLAGLPIAMWVASLVVAFFGRFNRLAITHGSANLRPARCATSR